MSTLKRRNKPRIKSQALAQAKKLAADYSLQYTPDEKEFSIYKKGTGFINKGESDLMVDADRWLPTISRKKRLTTKYFQKLASRDNKLIQQAKESGNIDKKSATIIELLQKQNENLTNELETIKKEGLKQNSDNRSNQGENNNSSYWRNTINEETIFPENPPDGFWAHAGDSKKSNTDKFEWNINSVTPTNTGNTQYNWTTNVDADVNTDTDTKSELKWTTQKLKHVNNLPLLMSKQRMQGISIDKDGKYVIDAKDFIKLDPNNISIDVKNIPKYKNTADAVKALGSKSAWGNFITDMPIFSVGDKYYNINTEDVVQEIDPVIIKSKSSISPTSFEKLMLNRQFNTVDSYKQIKNIFN